MDDKFGEQARKEPSVQFGYNRGFSGLGGNSENLRSFVDNAKNEDDLEKLIQNLERVYKLQTEEAERISKYEPGWPGHEEAWQRLESKGLLALIPQADQTSNLRDKLDRIRNLSRGATLRQRRKPSSEKFSLPPQEDQFKLWQKYDEAYQLFIKQQAEDPLILAGAKEILDGKNEATLGERAIMRAWGQTLLKMLKNDHGDLTTGRGPRSEKGTKPLANFLAYEHLLTLKYLNVTEAALILMAATKPSSANSREKPLNLHIWQIGRLGAQTLPEQLKKRNKAATQLKQLEFYSPEQDGSQALCLHFLENGDRTLVRVARLLAGENDGLKPENPAIEQLKDSLWLLEVVTREVEFMHYALPPLNPNFRYHRQIDIQIDEIAQAAKSFQQLEGCFKMQAAEHRKRFDAQIRSHIFGRNQTYLKYNADNLDEFIEAKEQNYGRDLILSQKEQTEKLKNKPTAQIQAKQLNSSGQLLQVTLCASLISLGAIGTILNVQTGAKHQLGSKRLGRFASFIIMLLLALLAYNLLKTHLAQEATRLLR